jgi:hypothetical protein
MSETPIVVTVVPTDTPGIMEIKGNVEWVGDWYGVSLDILLDQAVSFWDRWDDHSEYGKRWEIIDRAVRDYVGEERWVIECLKHL